MTCDDEVFLGPHQARSRGHFRDAIFPCPGGGFRAEILLTDTAEKLRDRRKSRAIVLGNLTLARIRQRDVEAAVASLTEAIAELESTRGGGGLNLVFEAAHELRPWRQEALVADVHDRLFGLMSAA